MKPKRHPSNTAASAVRALRNVVKPAPEPPADLLFRPEDRAAWDRLMRARAREEWSGDDLALAVQLARAMTDFEEQSGLLYAEGMVVKNDRGTSVGNPRCSVLRDISQRVLALRRSLQLGGAAAGDKRHVAGVRRAETAAERMARELDEDDPGGLLARP